MVRPPPGLQHRGTCACSTSMKLSLWPAWLLGSSLLPLAGCQSGEPATAPPPPLPAETANATPAAPTTASAQGTEATREANQADAPSADAPAAAPDTAEPSKGSSSASKSDSKNAGTSLYDLVARGEATLPTTTKPSTPVTDTPASSKPASSTSTGTTTSSTTTSTTKPATSSTNKVTIPNTANVKIEVPAGLQQALNADTRMQAWLNQVVKVIDSCYATERKKSASAAGVIVARITMHSESRPDADIKSLPSALSGVVACATGSLMRIKMPLFTAKEGESHTVNIRFTP